MTTPKQTRRVKRVKHWDFLEEVARYIKSIGGNALVVGGIRIRERPPLQYNFTLEVDFTGRALPKKSSKKRV